MINFKNASFLKVAGVILFASLLQACVSVPPSNVYHSPSAAPPPLQPKILLFPADVDISYLTAGGDLQTSAELSEMARDNYGSAAMNLMFERGVQFVPYGTHTLKDEHVDVQREVNTIMDSVRLQLASPSAVGSDRNLSLSQAATQDLLQYGADYAIFTNIRAQASTGGRKAVAVLAAIGGVAMTTSNANFWVAVFDANNGEVKWANWDPNSLPDAASFASATEQQWEGIIEHMFSEFSLQQ